MGEKNTTRYYATLILDINSERIKLGEKISEIEQFRTNTILVKAGWDEEPGNDIKMWACDVFDFLINKLNRKLRRKMKVPYWFHKYTLHQSFPKSNLPSKIELRAKIQDIDRIINEAKRQKNLGNWDDSLNGYQHAREKIKEMEEEFPTFTLTFTNLLKTVGLISGLSGLFFGLGLIVYSFVVYILHLLGV